MGISFRGRARFASVVEAAGGLDVEVTAAVRDPAAGLLHERSGAHHVDGATVPAVVRSRHPEQLVDGRWVPTAVDPDGRARTDLGPVEVLPVSEPVGRSLARVTTDGTDRALAHAGMSCQE